jgi:hypothetical protein
MEQAKQQIMTFKPKIKQSTLDNYMRTLEQIRKYMDKNDYDFIFNESDETIKFLHNMKNKNGTAISYLTKRNYLNAFIVLLQSQDPPNKELIAKYMKLRDEYNEKYTKDQEDSKVSEKQAPNFITLQELDDMLKDMRGDIAQKDLFKKENLNRDEKTQLKAYIIFHFHRTYPIRNELAGIKLIGKREYNKLTEEDKMKNNYIINMRPNYELSLGDYKTNQHHGIKLFIIDKQNEILLKKWIKINNIQKGDVIFPMSRTDLSNLLINYSKRYINKNVSTTMIRKAHASVHTQNKKKMEDLADIMTHKVSAQMASYQKEA